MYTKMIHIFKQICLRLYGQIPITVYRVILAPCYFRLSTRANCFAQSWFRPDTVTFVKTYINWDIEIHPVLNSKIKRVRIFPCIYYLIIYWNSFTVSNARCEDLERILTPTDISFNDGFETGRSSISSDRSFPSFPRPSRRISDVLGPRSNFDYVWFFLLD